MSQSQDRDLSGDRQWKIFVRTLRQLLIPLMPTRKIPTRWDRSAYFNGLVKVTRIVTGRYKHRPHISIDDAVGGGPIQRDGDRERAE